LIQGETGMDMFVIISCTLYYQYFKQNLFKTKIKSGRKKNQEGPNVNKNKGKIREMLEM